MQVALHDLKNQLQHVRHQVRVLNEAKVSLSEERESSATTRTMAPKPTATKATSTRQRAPLRSLQRRQRHQHFVKRLEQQLKHRTLFALHDGERNALLKAIDIYMKQSATKQATLEDQLRTIKTIYDMVPNVSPEAETSPANRLLLGSGGKKQRASERKTVSPEEESFIQKQIECGLYQPSQVKRLNTVDADDYCEMCLAYKVVDPTTDMHICKRCMRSTPYMENDSKNLSFGERIQFTKNIAYERINHFRKWITNIQGQERTIVPKEVIQRVEDAIYSNSFKSADNSDIDVETIKYYLRKIGHAKYYANAPQIERILTGRSVLTFTQKETNILISMFHQYLEPFEKFKKNKRENSLYYGYLLYKFCELQGWYQYLPYLGRWRLKSEDCRAEHDEIWKQICEYRDWRYIETPIA